MYNSKDFTPLRSWTIDNDVNVTKQLLKDNFEEVIKAAGLNISIYDIEIDKKIPGVSLRSRTDDRYMGIYVYCQGNIVEMALEGKGHQIKATDLEKVYSKAVGTIRGVHAGYTNTKNILGRFGMRGTGVSIGAGVGVAAGAAIGASIRGVVKLGRLLLRDQEAYDKEMGFYELAIGLGDYIVGGTDPAGITKALKTNAEENNDEIAQYLLGNAYCEGRGVEVSLNEAVKYYSMAAKNGEKRSKEIIAVEYLYGENEYSTEEKNIGLEYLKEMADAGDEEAAIGIIDIYGFESVEGISGDMLKMIEAAEVYANRGNTYAIIVLARTYDTKITNQKVSDAAYKDDTKAARWYQSIIEHGDREYRGEAAMSLANMYVEGHGVEKNPEEAVKYFEIASQCGNIKAKSTLLYCYTYGIGTEKDYAVAEKLSKEVIHGGNEEERAIAYYCSYVINDAEEKYGASMDYARKYIALPNAAEDKKKQLEKYLEEKEEIISQMNEDERCEYLKIKKKVKPGEIFKKVNENPKLTKILLAVIGVIVVALIATFIVKGVSNNDKLNTTNKITEGSAVELNADYELTSECKETDVFINNDTEILVRTEVDVPNIIGNEDLDTGVKKWAIKFEENADTFRKEYSDYPTEDLEYMYSHTDSAFYGTEYPVYFYSRDKIYNPTEDDFLQKPRSDDKVLSIIYSSYIDMGGAHGMSGFDAGNFDVESGKLLSLEMIANDYEEFSSAVITCIIEKIENQNEGNIFEGYESTIQHLWDEDETYWYMSDQGIVFIYNVYFIASYADGPIIVEVPYSEILEYMDEKYVK